MFPPFQHLRNEAPRRITAIARMVMSHFSGHIKATIMPAAKATATVPFDLFLLPIIGHLISDIIIRRLRLNVNFIRHRCIKAKKAPEKPATFMQRDRRFFSVLILFFLPGIKRIFGLRYFVTVTLQPSGPSILPHWMAVSVS